MTTTLKAPVSRPLDTTLRSDVALLLEEEGAVLTGEHLKELARFQAAQLGLTYAKAVQAAAKGTLPDTKAGKELAESFLILGVKVKL